MPDVLVLYGSTHGHTAKIARRIAETIGRDGVGARAVPIDEVGDLDPRAFAAVVVGASIHAGHHQQAVVDWAGHHHTALASMPSAFFSVCLTAAEDTDEARETTRDYLDDFEERTGWTPRERTTFAGALQYREYDFFVRQVIRLMMGKGGHPTDTSRDFDYTDWDAVDAFAHTCAAMAGVPTAG